MNDAAGYSLLAIAALHLGSGLLWGERLAARVPPPWTQRELRVQRDFWSHLGSFAVPLGLLGVIVIRSDPPAWLGWALLAWTSVCLLRAPRSGFWLLLVPAGLLLGEELT